MLEFYNMEWNKNDFKNNIESYWMISSFILKVDNSGIGLEFIFDKDGIHWHIWSDESTGTSYFLEMLYPLYFIGLRWVIFNFFDPKGTFVHDNIWRPAYLSWYVPL